MEGVTYCKLISELIELVKVHVGAALWVDTIDKLETIYIFYLFKAI
jgi:hypothetical protein